MTTRKTANDVDTSLKIHEKMCEERWKTIYKKTDSLQESVDSMKIWLRSYNNSSFSYYPDNKNINLNAR